MITAEAAGAAWKRAHERGSIRRAGVGRDRAGGTAGAAPLELLRRSALVALCLAAACRPEPGRGSSSRWRSRASIVCRVRRRRRPAALAAAVRTSVAYYAKLPAAQQLDFGPDRVTAGAMRDALAAFAASWKALRHRRRSPARSRGASTPTERRRRTACCSPGIAPALAARANRDQRFRHPVLGRPRDLVTASPADFGATCAPEIVGRVEGRPLAPLLHPCGDHRRRGRRRAGAGLGRRSGGAVLSTDTGLGQLGVSRTAHTPSASPRRTANRTSASGRCSSTPAASTPTPRPCRASVAGSRRIPRRRRAS